METVIAQPMESLPSPVNVCLCDQLLSDRKVQQQGANNKKRAAFTNLEEKISQSEDMKHPYPPTKLG